MVDDGIAAVVTRMLALLRTKIPAKPTALPADATADAVAEADKVNHSVPRCTGTPPCAVAKCRMTTRCLPGGGRCVSL